MTRPILQLPTSTLSLDYLTDPFVGSNGFAYSASSETLDYFGGRDVSLSPISGRFPHKAMIAANERQITTHSQKSRGSQIAVETETKMRSLLVCPGPDTKVDVDQIVKAVQRNLDHFSDELSLLIGPIKSLCTSAQPTVKRTGYQLVRDIFNTHDAHLSNLDRQILWKTLSHSKLEHDSLTLQSQLDALDIFVERQDASQLLVTVFSRLLSWLPDGTDIGNLSVETLKRCDHILMKIISKNASFLGDFHYNELLERYCSSIRCALQDDRFHQHPHHIHHDPSCQDAPHSTTLPLTIEERATRLMDFRRHIQKYGFIPETSFPILVRTISRLAYHFNICVAPSSSVDTADHSVPKDIQALKHRCAKTTKRLLEDRHFGWPAFEAIVLPEAHYDWRFAVGAIFIARDINREAFLESPRPLSQTDAAQQQLRETTLHFEEWMRMLGRIPAVWLGKIKGDRVLTELSYLAEEIIVYCNYHQASEMAWFIGYVISGLADALKKYRCPLGLKRRFTLGGQQPHSNPLIARAEYLLSMDITTVMRPPLVITLMSLTEHICDESMVRVIAYLRESGRLEPTFPYWRPNLKRLLDFFAAGSQDYPNSRESIANYLVDFYNSAADIDVKHDEIYEEVVSVWERTLPSETSETILTAGCGILCKEIIMSYGLDPTVSDRIRSLWRGIALQKDYVLHRSLIAVKFLIVAFNNFAFPAARKLDMLVLNADRNPAAAMAITLFQDLLYLAGMNGETDGSTRGPNMACQSARLIILHWLLRLRSGARHRIFTVDGPLSEVYPLAKLAYRIGEEAEAMSWSLKTSLDARYFRGTSHASPVINTFESFRNERNRHWLPVSLYVSMLCDILDYDCDWGPVSLVLCHLPLQLANKHFFCGPKVSPTIRRLAESVCSAISQDRLYKQMSGITPSQPGPVDVKAVLYQTLTVLISYRWSIQANEDDEVGKGILIDMISAFVDGLGTSVATSKPCLEALSLCVFSLPMLYRFGSTIIERLSRTMTNPDVATHTLEFLLVMGFGPSDGHKHTFRSEDYHRVFLVALMYIDHHYRPDVPLLKTSDGSKSFALAQHVLNMAFYVMHLWFTNLKPSERVHYIPLITDHLMAANGKGPLRPATAVFLDWIARYAHGKVDPKIPISPLYRSVVCPNVDEGWDYNVRREWGINFQNEQKNIDKFKAWKLGASIITISSMKVPVGWVRIVNRRPSCMVELVCRLEGEHDPSLSTEDFEEGFLERVLRDTPLDDMSQPDPVSGLPSSGFSSTCTPTVSSIDPALLTPLLMTQPTHASRRLRRFQDPNQQQFRSFLEHIDNTPVIDTHKVGVVYVGPGQGTEHEILSNRHGSPAYSKFINNLGRVIVPSDRLEVYTGGLDTRRHGRYALAWWNDISQLLFHVASFMPPHGKDGIECKKAEIGNDGVKIIWNESGKPYQINTLPSAFNLINLIIEPHTLMPKACYQENHHINGFFKVLLQTHPDLPRVTPIGEFKIVAAKDLPSLMRRYSMIACMFCHSWATTGMDKGINSPLETNWQSRLDLINRTEKFLVSEEEDEEILHGYSNIGVSPTV